MDILYHELRRIEPSKARQLVRGVLKRNGGNVSKTARILGISRQTVRRAREGPLEDLSRRPHRSPRKTEHALEEFIVKVGRKTGYRYRRLCSHLYRKYGIKISENTIKAILKRNKVTPRKRKAGNGSQRSLYDYEALIPFEEFQLDTKHLLDKRSLPKDVYEHMKGHNLPRYEWNMIDVCTRMRFTAYSYELSSVFGLMFIVLVVLWLRAHNVRHRIRIRMDNGPEFCSGSGRKLQWWNKLLGVLGVEVEAIPPGATYLMAIVENSHRVDDEYFLMIHAQRCNNGMEFLERAQRWQDTWNFYRPSYGKAMQGKTPYEKFKEKYLMVNAHVLKFPVLLMEELLRKVGLFTKFLLSKQGGKYVYTTCR
ncbi:MAG: IS481 family transposase [Nitrospirae bacterium]|nr:IS481 family transposase [Nitrospirota bacterium]